MAKKIADVRDEKSLAALNKIIGLLENKKKFDEMIKKGRTMHQRKTVREFEKKLVGNLDKNNQENRKNHFGTGKSSEDIKTKLKDILKVNQRMAHARVLKSVVTGKSLTNEGYSKKETKDGVSLVRKISATFTGLKGILKPNIPGTGGGKGEGENPIAKGKKSMLKFAVGGSIVAMLGKRLFDSSPLLKAMMSLFNTSLMLIFRPIGDMIGGFLRPIMLFFMRNIAIPFYKENKNLMNLGKMAGKEFLNFFLNPGMFIGNAIAGVKNDHEKFLVSWWMNQTNKKEGRNYTREEAMALVSKSGDGAVGGISGIQGGIKYNSEKQLEAQEEITYNSQNMVDESSKQVISATTITDSASSVKDSFNQVDLFGAQIQLSAESSAHAADSVQSYWEAIALMFKNLQESLKRSLRSTINARQSVGKDAGVQTRQLSVIGSVGSFGWGTTNPAAADAAMGSTYTSQSRLQNTTTYAGGLSPAELKRKKDLDAAVLKYESDLRQSGINAGLVRENFSARAEQIVKSLSPTAAHRLISNLYEDIKRKYGGNMNLSEEAWRILNAVNNAKVNETVGFGSQDALRAELASQTVGMANGGIINEPIFGIGASGKRYSFGERGAETVTPGVGGSNVININIGNVSRDADFDKLKPLIQRWLLESHSRRGLI